MHNIILVTIDALRADFTGCLGGKRITPNIDKLAKESILFKKTYSTGPKTPFSFPAIFCSRFRNMQKNDRIPRYITAVAEVFQKEGFRTIGIQAGNPYLSRYYNYDKGFDVFLDYIFPQRISEAEKNKIALVDFWKRSTPHILKSFQDIVLNRTVHIECEKIITDAEKYINCYMGKDLFIWLHLMDLHYPLVPKKQLLKSKKEYNYSFFSYLKALHKHAKLYSVSKDARRYRYDTKSLNSLKQFYSCCVQHVDMAIGRLTSFLKKNGIYDDSILILTSDHGECLGDHGLIGHPPNALWNTLLHVPLITKIPTQKHPKKIEKAVSHIDLFPSIFKMMNIKIPWSFKGKDVLFKNGETKPVYSYGRLREQEVVCCIYNGWKYMRYEASHKEKLYNLEEDPSEEFDKILNYSHKVKRMKKFIKEFILWASNENYKTYSERPKIMMKISKYRSKSSARKKF